MTDIVITAANVMAGTGSNAIGGAAGETVTAGKAVYRAAATGLFMLADSNSATAEARAPLGIALNGASAGQPLSVLTSGPVTIGATLTAGVAYYLSDTPGGICPVADIGTGEYVVFLGLATSTSVLSVRVQASGTAN